MKSKEPAISIYPDWMSEYFMFKKKSSFKENGQFVKAGKIKNSRIS